MYHFNNFDCMLFSIWITTVTLGSACNIDMCVCVYVCMSVVYATSNWLYFQFIFWRILTQNEFLLVKISILLFKTHLEFQNNLFPKYTFCFRIWQQYILFNNMNVIYIAQSIKNKLWYNGFLYWLCVSITRNTVFWIPVILHNPLQFRYLFSTKICKVEYLLACLVLFLLNILGFNFNRCVLK